MSVVDEVLPDGDDRPFVVAVEVAAFAGGDEAVAFASGDGLAVLLVALTWALSTVFLVPVAAVVTPSIPWHCFLFGPGPDCDTTDGESPLVTVAVAAAVVVSSCSLSGEGRFVPRLATDEGDADGGGADDDDDVGSSVEMGCDGLVVVDMVR